jgi:cell division protein FtsB
LPTVAFFVAKKREKDDSSDRRYYEGDGKNMHLVQEIRRRLRHVLAPLFWLVLTFYFGYHAVNGERGLRRMFELKQEIKIASQVADEIASRRARMEQKVRQLSPQSIDMDMLDESARSLLNMGTDGDYVIFDTE